MKMVASAARQAMTMRQWFTTLRWEHGWTSGLGVLSEMSRRAVVLAGGGSVRGFGSFLGIRIAAELVVKAVVEFGDSLELKVAAEFEVAADRDEETGLLVDED